MPDLTLQGFYHCLTAEVFSISVLSNSDLRIKYTVRWDSHSHKSRDNVQYDYSCNCDGYKFHKGYCKHIKYVIENKLHCNWQQFIDGGELTEDKRCPNCGGEVVAQMHGV